MALIDLTTRGPILIAPWRHGAEPEPSRDCFVSHTVFAFRHWRDLPKIGLAANRAAMLFARQPGSVSLAQWLLPGRRLMGDLSIWHTEEHLRHFLVHPEHVQLVTTWTGRMHGTHVSWSAPVDRAAIWARAKESIRATR